MSAGENSGIEAWKCKYYDLLGQLEEKEDRWRQTDGLLRQGISRLTLLADDRDPELKQPIAALRGALRRDADGAELATLIEQLSDAIRRADQGRAPRSPGLFGRLLSRDSGKATGSPSVALARDIVGRLGENVLGAGSDEARHFRAKLQAAREEREIARLADRLAEWVGIPPEPGAPLPIHEVLLRLIERLEIPDALESRADAVKAELVKGMSAEAVERSLEAIADLVTEMRSRVQDEKRNLESFLKQLTAGLQELDEAFRANAETQREALEGGRHLDAVMRDQVSDLELSVRDATDLSILQDTVRGHMETIRQHMHRFREAEEARALRAGTQVEHLTKRLRRVEGEVGKLRQRIRRERQQAALDPLTGIPNRLAYNERMAQEYARWRRYGHALCLVVWDVDHFKRINDVYGHQAGDRVLRVVAKVLAGNTRASDLVARYGGEEFAMLLPETDLADTMLVADKLRAAVADCDFHHRREPVAVTISCGGAQFRPGDDPDSVFRRADRALYLAKAEGRNRCQSEEDLQ